MNEYDHGHVQIKINQLNFIFINKLIIRSQFIVIIRISISIFNAISNNIVRFFIQLEKRYGVSVARSKLNPNEDLVLIEDLLDISDLIQFSISNQVIQQIFIGIQIQI